MGEIMRRVQQFVQFCFTSAASDESGPVGRVQMRPDDLRTFDNVPIYQHFGFFSCPPVGTQVVRLCALGDSTTGVGVASLHAPSRPANGQPGQSGLHDQAGSRVLLDNQGNVHIYPNGGNLIVHGDATVMGTVEATGEVWAMNGLVHLSTHEHDKVKAGTDISGHPIPNT